MKKLRLGVRMNLIFAVVTAVSCVIFLFIIEASFSNSFAQEAYRHVNQVHQQNIEIFNEFGRLSNFSDYDGFAIFSDDGEPINYCIARTAESPALTHEQFLYIKGRVANSESLPISQTSTYMIDDEIGYVFSRVVDTNGHLGNVGDVIIILTMTNNPAYIAAISGRIREYTMIAFVAIFVLGTIVIFLFSKSIVDKLNSLNKSVVNMLNNNYSGEVSSPGDDEISALANSIENLRQEVLKNEETKQEMIQNIGHDLKTPITVIRSYAEAMRDGVSTDFDEDTETIIRSTLNLGHLVDQLLEFSKLSYVAIADQEELVDVDLKECILAIVNDYKYTHSEIEITTNLDNSTYHMTRQRFVNVMSNLIDNALRYAQSKIIITLKKGKLTIFNDGEQVEEKLLPVIFKPYERGNKGKFGLGLSIVKTTLGIFNLRIKCQNVTGGVEFVIEPYATKD